MTRFKLDRERRSARDHPLAAHHEQMRITKAANYQRAIDDQNRREVEAWETHERSMLQQKRRYFNDIKQQAIELPRFARQLKSNRAITSKSRRIAANTKMFDAMTSWHSFCHHCGRNKCDGRDSSQEVRDILTWRYRGACCLNCGTAGHYTHDCARQA